MNFRLFSLALVGAAACVLSGCQSGVSPSLPRGSAAYQMMPPPAGYNAQHEYRVGPLDVLSITVFQEPSLSFPQLPVDASGNITMPLIGAVRASGLTTAELAASISQKLDTRYLRDSQVSVVVVASVSQHVTVEGNVTAPGIYEISGTSTLLGALAQAKSPTRVANLDQIVVFRMINGHRAGAVFDVNKIRAGEAPDPEILGGDVIVVGFSAIKGAFRDFLTTAPFFSVFRYF